MVGSVSKLLALLIALWALGVAIYLLAFAQVSYETVTVTGVQGESPTTTTSSGQEPWIADAEPFSIAFILAFSALLALGAYAAWRGSIPGTAALALLTLILSYISGFSIGLFYLPGSVALTVCAILLVAARAPEWFTTKSRRHKGTN